MVMINWGGVVVPPGEGRSGRDVVVDGSERGVVESCRLGSRAAVDSDDCRAAKRGRGMNVRNVLREVC